jgi:hypothetical protein
MKKLPLGLAAIVALSFSLSCKKETTSDPQKLPAVQKIREAISKSWEVKDKSLAAIPIIFSQKLKPEFANYNSDTNTVLSVWVRFKDEDEDVLLPHVVPGFGGSKYYFYSFDGGKPTIYFHNSGNCDLSGGGTSAALPMEEVSFNFTKITY